MSAKDREDRRRLVEAIVDPESSPYPPSFEIVADGKDLSKDLEFFTVEANDNGVLVLDATFSRKLSTRRFVNARGHATAYIGGVPVRMWAGRFDRPKRRPTHTRVLGYSGGYYLDGAKLQKEVRFAGPASRLIRRAVEDTHLYGKGRVRVEKMERRLKRDGEDSLFAPEQAVRDLLTAIQEEAGCVYRDTPEGPLGSFEALEDPGMGEAGEAVWSYEASEETGFEEEPETDAMWHDVVVERKADPEHTDEAGNPAPIPGWLVRVPVRYKRLQHDPPKALTDWHVVSDEDGLRGKEDGRRYARGLARRHARLLHSLKLSVTYNPLLRKYHAILVNEEDPAEDGVWRYEWLCVIQTLKWDSKTMTTEISALGHVLRETFAPHAPPAMPGPSPFVVESKRRTVPSAKAVGVDANGLWVDPDYAVNADGEKWAGFDEGGMWIDPDLAPPNVAGVDASGNLWIDPSGGAIGLDEGGMWIDPDLTINERGQRWAGIDENGLWIDPNLAPEGLAGIDEATGELWIEA